MGLLVIAVGVGADTHSSRSGRFAAAHSAAAARPCFPPSSFARFWVIALLIVSEKFHIRRLVCSRLAVVIIIILFSLTAGGFNLVLEVRKWLIFS